jgi:hypothetical protein
MPRLLIGSFKGANRLLSVLGARFGLARDDCAICCEGVCYMLVRPCPVFLGGGGTEPGTCIDSTGPFLFIPCTTVLSDDDEKTIKERAEDPGGNPFTVPYQNALNNIADDAFIIQHPTYGCVMLSGIITERLVQDTTPIDIWEPEGPVVTVTRGCGESCNGQQSAVYVEGKRCPQIGIGGTDRVFICRCFVPYDSIIEGVCFEASGPTFTLAQVNAVTGRILVPRHPDFTDLACDEGPEQGWGRPVYSGGSPTASNPPSPVVYTDARCCHKIDGYWPIGNTDSEILPGTGLACCDRNQSPPRNECLPWTGSGSYSYAYSLLVPCNESGTINVTQSITANGTVTWAISPSDPCTVIQTVTTYRRTVTPACPGGEPSDVVDSSTTVTNITAASRQCCIDMSLFAEGAITGPEDVFGSITDVLGPGTATRTSGDCNTLRYDQAGTFTFNGSPAGSYSSTRNYAITRNFAGVPGLGSCADPSDPSDFLP